MSQMIYEPPADITRYRIPALAVGVLGLIACVIGAFADPAAFFHSYLFGFLFWFGITLGCLALTMLQYLSGGAWGIVIRRFLESATRVLPLMAVLFIPLLFGLHRLYEWSHGNVVSADEALRHKSLYLNVPFFIARVVIYFAIWLLLAYLLNKWGREQDQTGDRRIAHRLEVLSGPGLVIYFFTLTFAMVDWVMSLEPHWFSTIYGLLFAAGQGLSALAFTTAVLVLLARRAPLANVISPHHLHDLGKLMFALVMLWAYLSFSQFLITWSGNLPEEIPWYIRRLNNGWQYVALLIVLFHFAVPFLYLLSRDVKRNPRLLLPVAIGIVVMRMVDLFWVVAPAPVAGEHETHLSFRWMDLAALIGLGGVWLAFYLTQLTRRPLLPLNDPNLQEALEHGQHH